MAVSARGAVRRPSRDRGANGLGFDSPFQVLSYEQGHALLRHGRPAAGFHECFPASSVLATWERIPLHAPPEERADAALGLHCQKQPRRRILGGPTAAPLQEPRPVRQLGNPLAPARASTRGPLAPSACARRARRHAAHSAEIFGGGHATAHRQRERFYSRGCGGAHARRARALGHAFILVDIARGILGPICPLGRAGSPAASRDQESCRSKRRPVWLEARPSLPKAFNVTMYA
mmetsp:Transcript_14817/g.40621  ORF Transcript_14817/g.40621 Transcript_14817/m.40621 type:complete len:234 (-) Transcript_14817:221-922(-)